MNPKTKDQLNKPLHPVTIWVCSAEMNCHAMELVRRPHQSTKYHANSLNLPSLKGQ